MLISGGSVGVNSTLLQAFNKELIIIKSSKKPCWKQKLWKNIVLKEFDNLPEFKYYIRTKLGIIGFDNISWELKQSVKKGFIKIVPFSEFFKENPDKKYTTTIEKSLEELEDLEELVNLIKK